MSPPPLQSPNLAARFIQGSGVALREVPSGQGKIIDRVDKGRKVGLVEPGETWSRVRDELTQKEGWIATRFLADAVRHPDKSRKDTSSPQKLPEPKVPVIPDTAIIQRIIAFRLGIIPDLAPAHTALIVAAANVVAAVHIRNPAAMPRFAIPKM